MGGDKSHGNVDLRGGSSARRAMDVVSECW